MSTVLRPIEWDLLKAFFALERSDAFVFTGGAALSEFYLQHRRSDDLDLFTLDEQAFTEAVGQTRTLGEAIGADEKPIRALTTLKQVLYVRGDDEVKVDWVRDSSPSFGQALVTQDIRVDALENIGANKILALFGRATPRDYVDLYFILHEGSYTFDHLFGLAKQKDLGLQPFYLANWIRQQTPRLQSLPVMLRPVDLEAVKQYFLQLAETLLAGLNPDKQT